MTNVYAISATTIIMDTDREYMDSRTTVFAQLYVNRAEACTEMDRILDHNIELLKEEGYSEFLISSGIRGTGHLACRAKDGKFKNMDFSVTALNLESSE